MSTRFRIRRAWVYGTGVAVLSDAYAMPAWRIRDVALIECYAGRIGSSSQPAPEGDSRMKSLQSRVALFSCNYPCRGHMSAARVVQTQKVGEIHMRCNL